MENELNYELDVSIDESALDLELLHLSSLTLKYNIHLANCRLAMDKAKDRMEFVRAEIMSKMRKNPDDFKIGKVTEGALSEALLQQKEYKAEQQAFNSARYDYEVAQAASRSMQDKKTALETLVKLHGQNYFSAPNLPHNLDREWEKKTKDKNVQNKIAAGTKKRRRE